MSAKARPLVLAGNQKRHLRALAHPLKPVVQIGHGGVSSGVIAEIDRALETHELIKIRVADECPIELGEAGEIIAAQTRSQVAQKIGKILVVYRKREKEPKITLPRARKPV